MHPLTTRLLLTAGIALTTGCLLVGCGSNGSDATASQEAAPAEMDQMNATGSEEMTREVVQRHLQTFGAGDLEGVLADYADDAVMFTPEGPLTGKAALRPAFVDFIEEFGSEGSTFDLLREDYDGEHAYITWRAETANNVYELGVDGFHVQGGQIVAQFFGAYTTPK